ncbi:DUF3192 domain-containing protein [Shewanella marina]|uniref:DUF3192 domain-containing protein n=1 Tax=Shewanella marina TaxID=487319 RepID=UPI000470A797|nr:DUF3192 domain-containing protein [Shewanella marina]
MPKMIKSLLVLPIIAGLSACSINIASNDDDSGQYKFHKIERQNKQHITQLNMGMTQEQVQLLMGKPELTEAYNKKGQAMKILFYRTQWQHGDGQTTKDECTALIFENGNLMGWGDTAYQQMAMF